MKTTPFCNFNPQTSMNITDSQGKYKRILFYICITKNIFMTEFSNLSYVQAVKEIKLLRTQKGVSQREMASRLGIGVSQYNKFETNSSYCNYEMLVRAAKILGKTAFISLG